MTSCVFGFVFFYVFLPAATVFQAVWAIGMATGTVKDLHFMLTGNRSLEGVLPPDDIINTPFEYAMGILVILASGSSFAAFMYIRHRAKVRRRQGRLLPYAAKAVPMSTLAVPKTPVYLGDSGVYSTDGEVVDIDTDTEMGVRSSTYEAFRDM